jgi:hypothetical protein
VNEPQYIPGVCNIGPAEIAVRKRFGLLGFALTALLWALLAFFHVGRLWLFLLFFPSALSAVGFIQAVMHFCAAFGLRSVFNVASKVGTTDTVLQAEFRAEDKKKARQILGYSIIVGLMISLVGYLLM